MNSESTSPQTLLLRNVRIVGTERVVERGSVLIETGRISRIADPLSSEKLRGDSELDLSGLTLFPGFIDLHIHGAAGVDAMAASAEDLNSVSEYLARHGVTGWLPTLVPAPRAQSRRLRRTGQRGEKLNPVIPRKLFNYRHPDGSRDPGGGANMRR